MPRTTVNIDSGVLRDLKHLQRAQGKPLGRIISELLAAVLAERAASVPQNTFHWTSHALRARIDLEDKEAVRKALESVSPGA